MAFPNQNFLIGGFQMAKKKRERTIGIELLKIKAKITHRFELAA